MHPQPWLGASYSVDWNEGVPCRVPCCERVEEQSRIQQVIDDVANHLNMGENIVLFTEKKTNSIDTQLQKKKK